MTTRQPKYGKDEHARLGTQLYERRVRPLVEEGNRGQVVAIDVDTGEYELAADTLTATTRLLDRLPEAQVWMVRIGHPAVHRFGYRIRK
jgi:hypothetical protein